MTETTLSSCIVDAEDLEDGEIESDGDDTQNHSDEKAQVETKQSEDNIVDSKIDSDIHYSKSGKKKKSKNKEPKIKDKKKKHNKYSSPLEDDFAGNIEKAIRKVLNKSDETDNVDHQEDVDDDRRKRKKRKKQDSKDGSNKKRRRQEYLDAVDESEMMCVRGASPVNRQSPAPDNNFQDEDQNSYESDSSHDSREHHRNSQRHRNNQRERKTKNDRDRRRGAHPMQDPDGVCLYYMQGKCHKADDCNFSHDAQPPRKMELCKFYLMDCCAKRDKCLYMHSDFPCKFYHTGLPCIYKDECKFAHGKPLSEGLRMILLKHIESAPKEILGEYPRLSREGAANMIASTQSKLMQQYSEGNDTYDKAIPSLFELNIPKPQSMMELGSVNNDKLNKNSQKARQSRWQNESYLASIHNVNNLSTHVNVLSIKNLNGVLTPRQISDLVKMGIENLDQLGQLTVLQLNSIGVSLKQITDIQLNTMNIQKLGLISTTTESQSALPSFLTSLASSKDMDLRVPPVAPVTMSPAVTELPGKDIDMRFQPSLPLASPAANEKSDNKAVDSITEVHGSKDMIDIDQYTKDALKFAAKEKENIENTNDALDNDKTFTRHDPTIISLQTKDIDHRVLKFADDGAAHSNKQLDNTSEKKETDTDIRFLQPEPLFRMADKRQRRSTTDDEDNNLLIDEKWYSSDEEKIVKVKSAASSPKQSSPPTSVQTDVIEPATVLGKIGDLSKIAISDEITQLLNTMKSNRDSANKPSENDNENDSKSRDPRKGSMKRSPDHKMIDLNKSSTKKPPKVSIYECIEGEPTDGRRRSDVDLRQNDFKLPVFGDTDLRPNSSGDIDFRLGLPFKAIPNYTPASEIDGSINSHPPIPYKVVTIDIPRPDYTDIRNTTAKSQALLDPRLRKVFRLSVDESNSDSEKSSKSSTGPRVDPRRKQKEAIEIQEPKLPTLDLQTILQNSDWYKDLSSTQKIFVNQNLASVTSMIKQHQQDKDPGKKFDITSLQSNAVLCSIFTNLGVSLNENAEFTLLPKPKEALLKTPTNFNQNFNISGNIDNSNMNMMNVPPHMNMGMRNNMGMGPMPGYNNPFQDPRGGPTPGLLGIAPNMPNNFDNNFGGPNNFGNMPYNGPGNDFGNMDRDQNYQRFPNRGGFRGRGNDRWNRGGSARGNRDRNNFGDRGGWQS